MTAPIETVQTFTIARHPVRRIAVSFGLVGSLLVVTLALIRQKEWTLLAVLDVVCLVGLVWLIALPSEWLARRLSAGNVRLDVGPDGLSLDQGGVCQRVPWPAIVRVHIETGDDGEPAQVDVYTAEGRALELREFDRLAEIVRLVRLGTPAGIPVDDVP
jgi:hypothetical protein